MCFAECGFDLTSIRLKAWTTIVVSSIPIIQHLQPTCFFPFRLAPDCIQRVFGLFPETFTPCHDQRPFGQCERSSWQNSVLLQKEDPWSLGSPILKGIQSIDNFQSWRPSLLGCLCTNSNKLRFILWERDNLAHYWFEGGKASLELLPEALTHAWAVFMLSEACLLQTQESFLGSTSALSSCAGTFTSRTTLGTCSLLWPFPAHAGTLHDVLVYTWWVFISTSWDEELRCSALHVVRSAGFVRTNLKVWPSDQTKEPLLLTYASWNRPISLQRYSSTWTVWKGGKQTPSRTEDPMSLEQLQVLQGRGASWVAVSPQELCSNELSFVRAFAKLGTLLSSRQPVSSLFWRQCYITRGSGACILYWNACVGHTCKLQCHTIIWFWMPVELHFSSTWLPRFFGCSFL